MAWLAAARALRSATLALNSPTEPFPTGITNDRFERGYRQDFKHVEYKAGEFDRQSGAPGLHTCKVPSSGGNRKTIVPPALFEQFNSPNFWRT